MVTREQLEEALGDDKKPFKIKDIDHDSTAISLLRDRIPYDRCKSVLCGAGHDIVYLCDADVAAEFLMEEDLKVLAECNCFVDEDNDCIALFV